MTSTQEVQRIIDEAKNATQGVWHSVSNNRDIDTVVIWDNDTYSSSYRECSDDDLKHIANTCPAVIVPLLEELLVRRARAFEGRLLISSEHLQQYNRGYQAGLQARYMFVDDLGEKE